ncbi:MAG: hypothetical protein P3X23_000950 [Thermosynechococcus sp. Uc]|uniref:hypothetical protein n=1 Tax=Thermosynechococcus sp. Uc TaxID=3034853 RepID=UPI0019E6715A|nr:hypothetical protein [Thermosynechococcus sp. Uc]MDM7325674.1 hypothetical protein [Thermosynechococcus sp. Uc]HIK26430.1 hypothetical protein [Thermosynechococcus sp. M46_R2017_013]
MINDIAITSVAQMLFVSAYPLRNISETLLCAPVIFWAETLFAVVDVDAPRSVKVIAK